MDFVHAAAKSITGTVIFLVVWAGDQLSGELFSNFVLGFIPPDKRSLVFTVIIVLGLSYFSFRLGMDAHSFHSTISRFRIFLKRKIKEAEALIKSKLPDKPTLKHPDGSIDDSDLQPFKNRYSQWRSEISGAFRYALKKVDSADVEEFENPKMPPTAVMWGEFRQYLKEDVERLRGIRKRARPDWLQAGIDADSLREYEGT